MKVAKIIKTVALGLLFGLHLFFALSLWLCGQAGNILPGIFLIVFYRLSLWSLPFAVTLVCWVPPWQRMPICKRIIFNLVLLLACSMMFVLCFLLFGNWY